MNVIYGPVHSWRLGKSLGIDLLCREEKICSFNCIYCELGEGGVKTKERAIYIEIQRLEEELRGSKFEADVITFSGMGEPTLASNLEEAVKVVKKYSNLPVAILTNSSLLPELEVQRALKQLDIVVAKLDAPDEELFQAINRPIEGIQISDILKALKHFREQFSAKLALQIMFIDLNKQYAKELAELALEIMPDEVQINTPLRYCGVKPLNSREIKDIADEFAALGLNTISVYNHFESKAEVEKEARRGIKRD